MSALDFLDQEIADQPVSTGTNKAKKAGTDKKKKSSKKQAAEELFEFTQSDNEDAGVREPSSFEPSEPAAQKGKTSGDKLKKPTGLAFGIKNPLRTSQGADTSIVPNAIAAIPSPVQTPQPADDDVQYFDARKSAASSKKSAGSNKKKDEPMRESNSSVEDVVSKSPLKVNLPTIGKKSPAKNPFEFDDEGAERGAFALDGQFDPEPLAQKPEKAASTVPKVEKEKDKKKKQKKDAAAEEEEAATAVDDDTFWKISDKKEKKKESKKKSDKLPEMLRQPSEDQMGNTGSQPKQEEEPASGSSIGKINFSVFGRAEQEQLRDDDDSASEDELAKKKEMKPEKKKNNPKKEKSKAPAAAEESEFATIADSLSAAAGNSKKKSDKSPSVKPAAEPESEFASVADTISAAVGKKKANTSSKKQAPQEEEESGFSAIADQLSAAAKSATVKKDKKEKKTKKDEAMFDEPEEPQAVVVEKKASVKKDKKSKKKDEENDDGDEEPKVKTTKPGGSIFSKIAAPKPNMSLAVFDDDNDGDDPFGAVTPRTPKSPQSASGI